MHIGEVDCLRAAQDLVRLQAGVLLHQAACEVRALMHASRQWQTDSISYTARAHLLPQADSKVLSFQGHTLDLAHCRISRKPAPAAAVQTSAVHGHGGLQDRRAFNTCSWPLLAAAVHACWGQWQVGCCFCRIVRASKLPWLAAWM